MTLKTRIYLLCSFLLVGCNQPKEKVETQMTEINNPILPGYFADPSLVQYEGKFYLYATVDPWGADFLPCWVSEDFRNWTFHRLNWPTKAACTSALSHKNMVWAPSVIQKGDMFYMYVSVGSEVWCGKAAHPLGPWENVLGDKPMISFDTTRYYHVIDAEAFIDDDGKAYLYWGSGWGWTNGHCFGARLNDDMASFATEPVEVTPAHYFEAPYMLKHNGKYYLTYSEGKTIDDTYKVCYAVGDHPLGTFEEAGNSPILTTNKELKVYGPGHHTLFTYDNKTYMLYHRHRWPFLNDGSAFRQTCLSELTFNDPENEINNIVPHHTQLFPDLNKDDRQFIKVDEILSSSEQNKDFMTKNVLDGSYATRWEATDGEEDSYLSAIFKDSAYIDTMEVRFEYPWKRYFIKVETADDKNNWVAVADHTAEGIEGSPVHIPISKVCKSVKISFLNKPGAAKPSVWELLFY